jgi:hypothetical protein
MSALHSEANTLPGLILSLCAALPDPRCPIARRATRLARRLLSEGAATRAERADAANLLADLLEATDAGLPLEADGLLSSDFDDD